MGLLDILADKDALTVVKAWGSINQNVKEIDHARAKIHDLQEHMSALKRGINEDRNLLVRNHSYMVIYQIQGNIEGSQNGLEIFFAPDINGEIKAYCLWSNCNSGDSFSNYPVEDMPFPDTGHICWDYDISEMNLTAKEQIIYICACEAIKVYNETRNFDEFPSEEYIANAYNRLIGEHSA